MARDRLILRDARVNAAARVRTAARFLFRPSFQTTSDERGRPRITQVAKLATFVAFAAQPIAHSRGGGGGPRRRGGRAPLLEAKQPRYSDKPRFPHLRTGCGRVR